MVIYILFEVLSSVNSECELWCIDNSKYLDPFLVWQSSGALRPECDHFLLHCLRDLYHHAVLPIQYVLQQGQSGGVCGGLPVLHHVPTLHTGRTMGGLHDHRTQSSICKLTCNYLSLEKSTLKYGKKNLNPSSVLNRHSCPSNKKVVLHQKLIFEKFDALLNFDKCTVCLWYKCTGV